MSENKPETNDKTERTEVSFDELSYSNMMSIEALFRVLQEEGALSRSGKYLTNWRS